VKYEAVIGLEVHAQLSTNSKVFCTCSTRFGAPPNSQTCPVCIGMPGALPVLNRKIVEFTIKAALATHCTIAPLSQFARKNYFYPDLPKGYQISQYELPLATRGYLEIDIAGESKQIGIHRIHMEEDAGKLFHGENLGDPRSSYVDLNRCGVPLIEIVSEPEIHSPEEARAYMTKLRDLLRYLEVCDGNMEEGSLRCDANVSLKPVGATELGVKTEVKNMNSFRFVQKALEYEMERQQRLLEQGQTIVQETRLWDSARGITLSMRSKEEAHDYRYFPEPDLVPLVVDPAWIEKIRASLPELPDAKKARFISQYGIPEYDAGILTASKALADYFEGCVRIHPEPKIVGNWIMGELLREMNKDDREIEDCPVTPEHLAELLTLIEEGTISGKMAKEIFTEMYGSRRSPREIVTEKGMAQISDERALDEVISRVISDNPDQVAAYRQGKEKLFGFFVGQIMKATKGQANPQRVSELLRRRLQVQ